MILLNSLRAIPGSGYVPSKSVSGPSKQVQTFSIPTQSDYLGGSRDWLGGDSVWLGPEGPETVWEHLETGLKDLKDLVVG